MDTNGLIAAIDRIPNRSTVLMSCDYDPGAIPELVPMTRTAMRHLLSKDCKIVITVLWNAGPGLVDSVTREVAREFLESGGYTVIEARDGTSAKKCAGRLRRGKNRHFNVILGHNSTH